MQTNDIVNDLEFNPSLLPNVPLNGTSAFNGDSVDCKGYDGPIHGQFSLGNVSGGPSSFSVACKLQESADASTWSDIATQTTGTITAAKGATTVRGLRTMRYVRCVATPTPVGGSVFAAPCMGNVVGNLKRVGAAQ